MHRPDTGRVPLADQPPWWLVIPVKEAERAKSRMSDAAVPRAELARALARDTLEAACLALPPAHVVVVTADTGAAAAATALGAGVAADPGAGLNAAVRAGVSRCTAADPGRHVAVLLGDLPALRPHDLVRALALCARYRRAVVPDADGTGTVLLTGGPGAPPEPRFGPGSARRHALRSTPLTPDLPRLRRDVDDVTSLVAAVRLGVGRHTAAVLARAAFPPPTVEPMQASVHAFDPESGTGTVLLDSGRLVPFDPGVFAASALRHLRMGQRVSVELDGDPEEADARLTRLWITGIGPGETIR